MIAFNINDTIRVKLTDYGRKAHWRNHVQYWNEQGSLNDHPYTPVVEDANGFSKWQMWSFMEKFGGEFWNGAENIIELNTIYIEVAATSSERSDRDG